MLPAIKNARFIQMLTCDILAGHGADKVKPGCEQRTMDERKDKVLLGRNRLNAAGGESFREETE